MQEKKNAKKIQEKKINAKKVEKIIWLPREKSEFKDTQKKKKKTLFFFSL